MATIRETIGRQQAKRVRDAHKEHEMSRLARKDLMFKLDAVKEDSDGLVRFDGYANVGTIDRVRDLIPPKTWEGALQEFMRYGGVLYFMHDWSAPIGRILNAKITERGLFVEGGIERNASPDTGEPIAHPLAQLLDYARLAVKRKLMRALSVGIRVLAAERQDMFDERLGENVSVQIIRKLELLEISLVTIPASREAVIAAKSVMASQFGDEWARALTSAPAIESIEDARRLIVQAVGGQIEGKNVPNNAEQPRVRVVSLRDDARQKVTITNLTLE